ncbi:MAG: hypothetical protein HYT67_00240 [Candidatus Yanofskybacteria bacterium]|nr:hypothetical protein [Candidatus Yanofskybacteria bacterium]
MAKRRTGIGGTDNRRRRSHSHKTKKRLEIKRIRLEALAKRRKHIAILIAGMVLTAGFAVGFGIPVFAGDPVEGLDITIEQIPGGRVSIKYYNSLRSRKSAGLIRMEVGDVLLRYSVGGADINKVTDALEGNGVYEAELKSFLVAIGVNEVGVQDVFTKLDELGIDADSSTDPPSAAGADSPEKEFTTGGAVSAPVAGDASQSTSQWGYIGLEGKALRDNFRENVKITIGHVDHGKTARIALAHGKGLRMLNRFRSAMARFDHILGRLESRIEKMRIEIEGEERAETGLPNYTFPPRKTVILIEEAKNIQVENEAKMKELKAKYESLLLGENAGGIAEEARAIATELKADIENLRAIIIEIYTQADDYNSSRSNTSI